MKPEDLKNSLNSIEPNSYMKTRLFAEIKDIEKPKKRNGKLFKAAVCTALCCAVLAAGVGIGIPKKAISNSNENAVSSDVDNSGNYFVMSVYAAENDKKTATPIDDHTVTFSDYRLDKHYDLDGVFSVGEIYMQSGLGINGNNIKSFKIKCEKESFHIWNFDLQRYLEDKGMYYDAIVPYSFAECSGCSDEEQLSIIWKHIENGDYDEYIKGKKLKPYDEYETFDILYDENDELKGAGIVSKENYLKVFPEGEIKEYTFENLLNKTENIGDFFSWIPDTSALYDNHDMPFSALPHDTITVEVTFNDGSVQYASYDFSFNDSGELVVDRMTIEE